MTSFPQIKGEPDRFFFFNKVTKDKHLILLKNKRFLKTNLEGCVKTLAAALIILENSSNHLDNQKKRFF